MKITFIIFFLLYISIQSVFAQPSQAEIDKMLKQSQELMKKYGNDTTVKKAMKDAQDKQKQVEDAMKNQQGNNNGLSNPIAIGSLYSSEPGSYGNVDNWRFPPKNIALLSSLPKKIFTKAELVSFLDDLYSQLSKKLTSGVAASVQSITLKYNNDGNKMGDAAVTGWYTNYQEEALLLIIKAAANNPENGVLLNNCAALLNMSGIEQKAIPILKYVLQSYAGNSMLLNNLGQAYAGLGETDTAMVYLGRCMKLEPEHPEACNTAGQIEATKGNKEKAVEYLEKSIKSAYTKTAGLKLSRIKKGAKIVPLVRPRVKLPEYFNRFKYDLPLQCTSIENAAVADAEHKAFREMITIQMQEYGSKLGVLGQIKNQELLKLMNSGGAARKLKKDEFMAHPFSGFCETMASELMTDYLQEVTGFEKWVHKQHTAQMAALENEYQKRLNILNDGFEKRMDNCGEGKSNTDCPTDEEKCTAYNKLANEYLPKFAYATEEMQKKATLIYSTYFDELVYWHYLLLHPIGDDDFKMKYYEFIIQYLVTMGGICTTKIIEPCEFTPTTATKESNTLKDFDCPVDVEIGFIVGSFEASCDKISFSAGEGAVFSYEKNFKTKKSTLSVGIGLQLQLGQKMGPVNVKAGAGVNESLFITFDGNNKVEDFGVKIGAKAAAGIGASAGNTVKVKKDLAQEEVSVGATFGINSGCNFNEGPLKGMIGPAPEKQLNKNVPIYKPD